MNDLTSGFFDPSVVIRDMDVTAEVNKFFKFYRNVFKVFFRELQSRSIYYP